MNVRLWLLMMICLSFLLISAKSVTVQPETIGDEVVKVTSLTAEGSLKKGKLNFLERLFLKFAIRKFKKAEDTAKADRQAKTSLTFGIAAISFLLIGLFVPYIVIASLPAGIVAMAMGNSAIHGNTNEYGKAKTGKALGLGSLIALAVLLIVSAIVLAAFLSSWN